MHDTLLTRLARFAVDLQVSDLPPGVLERVRLQHISAAGSVRRLSKTPLAQSIHRTTGKRGRAVKSTGGQSSARDALRLHSTLASAWGWDDQLFMGPTSVGGVSAGWALAKGHTVAELLRATAAANEVAGRLGAAMLFGPDPADACGEIHALSAATVAGLLGGLDASRLAHAMALAVAAPARIPFGVLSGDSPARGMAIAQAVDQGLEAVALAKKGVLGPLDVLEVNDGVLERGAWIPLRAAFTGLGHAWLTQTLCFKEFPAALPYQAPLQAVREVLRRHVKAADKRLRADQIQGIEIVMGAPGYTLFQRAAGRPATTAWSVPFRLSPAVGLLVAEHEVEPGCLDADAWIGMQERVAMVASKVEVRHDWDQTLGLVRHLVDVWSPLLAGVTATDLQAAKQASRVIHGQLPNPGLAGILRIMRSRPNQLLEGIRYASGDLSDARVDEWQMRMGTQVRVHTTRGGTWPENREIPEASPGWSWEQTRQLVFDKYAPDAEDRSQAAALCQVDLSESGDEWVRAMLSPA
jgi:2-methylcitrate dehydratase PrpD